MTILYEVISDGKVVETIKLNHDRRHDCHWLMVDRMQELKGKYGDHVTIRRRAIPVSC